jgi:hypothetical protein
MKTGEPQDQDQAGPLRCPGQRELPMIIASGTPGGRT